MSESVSQSQHWLAVFGDTIHMSTGPPPEPELPSFLRHPPTDMHVDRHTDLQACRQAGRQTK
mgnify:FL=1